MKWFFLFEAKPPKVPSFASRDEPTQIRYKGFDEYSHA